MLQQAEPLTPQRFQQLLEYQLGSIGGPLDCVVDIGKNGQQMRINRFDVNHPIDAKDTQPVFAAAARGNVILPKDGSWSMVKHTNGTGEVTPSAGEYHRSAHPRRSAGRGFNHSRMTRLLRVADPTDLLRDPVTGYRQFRLPAKHQYPEGPIPHPGFPKQSDVTLFRGNC